MKVLNTPHPLVLSLLITSAAISGFTSIAKAEDTKVATSTAAVDNAQEANKKAEDAISAVSEDGFKAVQSIHGARLAIFQGDPVIAMNLVNDAKMSLEKVSNDLSKKGEKANEKTFIPVDARLSVVEDFTDNEEKSSKIAEANQHLQNGDPKKGIETLQLADIAVSVTTYSMPLERTEKYIETAKNLMTNHQYYEANLALKGAVDGIVTSTMTSFEDEEQNTDHSSKGDKSELQNKNSSQVVDQKQTAAPKNANQ